MATTTLSAFAAKMMRAEHQGLRSKLILHRGWHRLDNDDDGSDRPLENTRMSCVEGARIGARYVECDVWCTKDGEIVLSHDENMKSMAADSSSTVASTSISEQPWSALSRLVLKDKSTPVLLKTVLADLRTTGSLLAIELKQPEPAKPLAEFLLSNQELLDAVGFVMGFNFESIEQFHQAYTDGGQKTPLPFPILWLLTNPVPADAYKDDTTVCFYNHTKEEFGSFLDRKGLRERFVGIQAGLNIQYNRHTSPDDVTNLKKQVAAVRGCPDDNVFIAMWSDRQMDAEWDSRESLLKWAEPLNALNTDLPQEFWE